MKQTLALEDNPFDSKTFKPVWPAGEPLDLVAEPGLRQLICSDLAHFAECERNSKLALIDKDNLIFIILGDRGSGRSTLANSIRQQVLGNTTAAEREWVEFTLAFETSPAGASGEEVTRKFDKLHTELTQKFGPRAGKALVLIDNLPRLPSDLFNKVVDLFNAFPTISRVFIVMSDDDELKKRDLDAFKPWIELLERPNLKSADVRALITHRVPIYYSKALRAMRLDPDLTLYPFKESVAEIKQCEGDGALPARSVIKRLARKLKAKHSDLDQPEKALTMPLDAQTLRERLID